jgi:hypothetical protein
MLLKWNIKNLKFKKTKTKKIKKGHKMSFLPEDYQAPKQNNHYLKLQDGENRIRILSKPIFGWEDWTLERKPVRFEMNDKPAKSIDPKKPLKHFWAFIVWNINEEQIQIMQITQATIKSSIEALYKDADWGSPFNYDIKINRKGEGIETEYTVNPAPHKAVSQEVLQAFKERPINLEALYVSGDPFSAEWKNYTPLMTNETTNVKPLYISTQQAFELNELLLGCSPSAQSGFLELIKKKFSADIIDELPESEFEKYKVLLTERNKIYQGELVDKEMANVKKDEEVKDE